MKKFLPTILILTTLLGFFAPVGISLKEIDFHLKTVRAEYTYNFKITPTMGDTTITLDIEKTEGSAGADSFSTYSVGASSFNANIQVYATLLDPSKENKEIKEEYVTFGTAITKQTIVFKRLESNHLYKTKIEIKERILDSGMIEPTFKIFHTYEIDTPTTKENAEPVIGQILNSGGTSDSTSDPNIVDNSGAFPPCGISPKTWFNGCLIRLVYYAFFVPTSYLFAFAGTFFDFTFAYSVNDSSYRTEFITQGWGIMRDFCNMFFIFVMLYIALSTILGFKKSKTQEMIINVIIVGLFINFSLFFTKVIIDSSNILARVFYTSDAIEITEKPGPDASNVVTTMGGYKKAGIIPMSAAIVNKIDPQSLVINANKINVPDTAGKADDGDMTGDGNSPGFGTWMIVIVLATAINIIGFTVFISVGLIFVLRIVGLWLAMIFSPLAFFSYTVPALGNIPKFGYKQWWPETLKMAFLAPIFMFFMYLILAFLDKGLNIMDAREEKNLMFVIAIMLPFAVIMVLMMEAKKIAVKFSGEMGAQVSKMGSSLGGMVLGATVGAATGGAALALRSTIGRAAVNKTQDADLQDKAKKGGMTGMWARAKLGTYDKIGKSTFDARNTGLAKKAESALDTKFTGNNRFTKVAEGGRAGALDRRIESREKSSEIYNKAIKRQDALDKINGKSKDLSEVDAYEADAKAKEWNRKYLKDMVEAKKAWEEDSDNKNDPFKENEYKLKYIANNGPEPLSASDQDKQKIKDEADTLEYGDDYVERRNKEKEEYRTFKNENGEIIGKEFNEREFRQNNNIQPVSNLGETKTKQLRELRSKIKPEKEPLNELEKYDIEKQRSSAVKKLELANNEIMELKKIAQEAGTDYDNPEKEKIDEAVKKKQEDVMELDNDINIETTKIQELTKELTRFGDLNQIDQKMVSAETKSKINTLNRAKEVLLEKQKAKKLNETAIRGLESLIKEKERYDNTVEKQKEIIKEADEKINRK